MGEETLHSSFSITAQPSCPNSTEHPVFHGPPPLPSPSPPWEMIPSTEILPSASCWELHVKLGVSLRLNWFPPPQPPKTSHPHKGSLWTLCVLCSQWTNETKWSVTKEPSFLGNFHQTSMCCYKKKYPRLVLESVKKCCKLKKTRKKQNCVEVEPTYNKIL